RARRIFIRASGLLLPASTGRRHDRTRDVRKSFNETLDKGRRPDRTEATLRSDAHQRQAAGPRPMRGWPQPPAPAAFSSSAWLALMISTAGSRVIGRGTQAVTGYGDGVDGAPNGISVPRWSLSPTHLKGSRPWASLSGISPLSRGSGSIWRRTRFRFTLSTRRARLSSRASSRAADEVRLQRAAT